MPGPPQPRPVELRVHGVSGTPADELLDRHSVYRLGGDAKAGFYRPSLALESRDTTPTPPFSATPPVYDKAPQLEGYSWGGLTSGSPARALWLLLLPFTLANVAIRMRPDTQASGGLARWTWRCARVIALALTALLVLTAIGVGNAVAVGRLTAGQQTPKVALVSVLSKLPGGWELFCTSAIPGLAVFALWLISGRSVNRYEQVTTVGVALPVAPPQLEENLGSAGMWKNEREVRRLRARHVQLGASLIVLSMLWGESPWSWTKGWAWPWGWWVLFAAVVVVLGTVVCASPQATDQPSWKKWTPWGLLLAGGVVAGLRLSHLSEADVTTAYGGSWTEVFEAMVWVDLAVLALAVAAMLVLNCVGSAQTPTPAAAGPMTAQQPGLWRGAMFWFTLLAVLLGTGYSGAFYLYAVAYLDTNSLRPSFDEISRSVDGHGGLFVIRLGAIATIFGVVLSLLVVLAFLGWAWRGRRRAGKGSNTDISARFAADYPPPLPPDSDRIAEVKKSFFVGGLVDSGGWVSAGFGVSGLAGALLAEGVFAAGPQRGYAWWQWVTDPRNLQAMGAYVAVYGVVILVAVGAAAFRGERTRRIVGILWDVASFWPRTAHPLAAPCYAERAVPDLVTRTAELLLGDAVPSAPPAPRAYSGRPVVLAAHSQGSVLAAATIFQLNLAGAPHLEDLRLLTFGCVLRRLYGTYFPVYFGPAQLAALYAILNPPPPPGQPAPEHWINLWRYTDFVGGSVSGGPPQPTPPATAPVWDQHAVDPFPLDRQPGFTTYPPTKTHFDFWSDVSGQYQAAVLALLP